MRYLIFSPVAIKNLGINSPHCLFLLARSNAHFFFLCSFSSWIQLNDWSLDIKLQSINRTYRNSDIISAYNFNIGWVTITSMTNRKGTYNYHNMSTILSLLCRDVLLKIDDSNYCIHWKLFVLYSPLLLFDCVDKLLILYKLLQLIVLNEGFYDHVQFI